jgi:holin-like protein
MQTLRGLAILLLAQSAGEAIARLTDAPLPGPVLGMLLLLLALRWPAVRTPVEAAAETNKLPVPKVPCS